MAQGRGAAAVGAVLVCLLLLQHSELSSAAIYTVGDDLGWTYNVSFWPDGKTFYAGDLLAFNYTPSEQNVVVVDKVGYNWCLVSPMDATVHHSGKDQIELLKGMNYIISSLPGHCQMGVKLSISAD